MSWIKKARDETSNKVERENIEPKFLTLQGLGLGHILYILQYFKYIW